MRKFIYIKERGFISYKNAVGTNSFQISGTGFKNSAFFSHDFAGGADDAANTTTAQARLRVTVTSAADNTGNRGDDYDNNNTVKGEVPVLKETSFLMVGNNLVIRSTSQDSAKGYDIKNNDLVEITDCFAQDTGEMMYSADRLIGLVKTSTTSTHLRFAAIEDNEGHEPQADDIIQFIYPAATGHKTHKKISKYFESWINGSNPTDGGLLLLDFNQGGYWPKELEDVYHLNVSKQP